MRGAVVAVLQQLLLVPASNGGRAFKE